MNAVLHMMSHTGTRGMVCGAGVYAATQMLRCIGACVLVGILLLQRLCSWGCECLASLRGC